MRTARVMLLLGVMVVSLTALKCPPDKPVNLSPISPTPTPNITVHLDASRTQITNGGAATLTVTVTRPPNSTERLSGPVELRASAEERPGRPEFSGVIATGTVDTTGSRPDLGRAFFTLKCVSAPEPVGGRVGSLAGDAMNTGRGARVCTPSIPNPCPSGCVGMPSNVCPAGCLPPPPNMCAPGCVAVPPNVCPDKCGTPGHPPCPPRCAPMPSNVCAVGCLLAPPNMCPSGCVPPPPNLCPPGCGAGVAACEDDPVTVVAVFRGVTSAEGSSLLCLPSVGPTQGGPIP